MYHISHALVAQQYVHFSWHENEEADRLVDIKLVACHGLRPHLNQQDRRYELDLSLYLWVEKYSTRNLLIQSSTTEQMISLKTPFVALAEGLVALRDPSSLMSVITTVMLIGLDQSRDCIVHNDEEEWSSILGSFSIWFETKSIVVPSGCRLSLRGILVEEISVWLF